MNYYTEAFDGQLNASQGAAPVGGHALSIKWQPSVEKTARSGVEGAALWRGALAAWVAFSEKGINFFKDYWIRTSDPQNNTTGDHIDLWNGSRLTDWTSWLRISMGLSLEGYWSDFGKSKEILFWRAQS
ncbi:hypothetical protein C7H09_08555 [Marinobacter fuscus]|uniref:Uncharacterized protein n=1 Tax=Marinobacter fuscus TaxID=2109942 RepID=A0A2T1KDS8_9GAMM|nr:T6SS effector amidase Tae4 family protein [Marinobacter fuscus]PSF08210.1 hypothetical protein C7H09_08555 [Marinobacter fuscus]